MGTGFNFQRRLSPKLQIIIHRRPLAHIFPKGICNMGFVHGHEPVRTPESATTLPALRFCEYFALGTCRKANYCPMVHDIRAQPAASSARVPDRTTSDTYKRGFCHYYREGRCRRGNSCRFRHDSDDQPPSPRPTPADPEASGEQETGWLADTDDWGTDPHVVSKWGDPAPNLQEEHSWGDDGNGSGWLAEADQPNWAIQQIPSSNPHKDDSSCGPAPVFSDVEPSEEQGTSWLADTDAWSVDPQHTSNLVPLDPVAQSQEDETHGGGGVDSGHGLDWFQEVEESRAMQDLGESHKDCLAPIPAHDLVDPSGEQAAETAEWVADPQDASKWGVPDPVPEAREGGGVGNTTSGWLRQVDDDAKWSITDPVVSKPQRADSYKRGVNSQTKSGWLQEIDDNEWSMEQQIEEKWRAEQHSANSGGATDDRKSAVCVFFLQNRCIHGDSCRYSHADMKSNSSPCNFFRRGLCRNGDSCLFSHETIDPPSHFPARTRSSRDHLKRYGAEPEPENAGADWLHQTDENSEWNVGHVDKWIADAPVETSGYHESKGWSNAAQSWNDLEVEQSWAQPCDLDLGLQRDVASSQGSQHLTQQSGASMPLSEPEPEIPTQHIYHCTVRFGSGATPEEVATPFDSLGLILSNYPLGIAHDDLVKLAEPYGVVKNTTFRVTAGGMRAHIEFEEYSQAAEARVNLNGYSLDDLVMHARLESFGSVGGNIYEPEVGRQLKLVWDAPSVSAWAFYPNVGMAQAESVRLNGNTYGERKISAEYVKPTQTHSIPVRICGLPLTVKREELHKFCVGSNSVALIGPNYRESQNDQILAFLTNFGPVNFFEVLPTDPSHLEITGFVEFSTKAAASNALKALNTTKSHDFLKGRISPHVHIYGRPKAVAQVNKSVQDLLLGVELAIWDPYFDTPSSDEALKRISDETSFHVQRDRRRRVLRVWGNREQAKKNITRLLKAVQAKRHSIRLDKDRMLALIKGGLRSLQDTFGVSKILLDVRSRMLIVLGDMKTEVESRLKAMTTGISSGTGSCSLCFSDASEPVELTCGHIYCSDCLTLLLRPVPGLEFAVPTCVAEVESGSCLIPISIRAILSRLSDAEQTELFEASLLAFVRSNPEFRFCPSGCPVIYRLGIAGTVYTCPDCSLDLCASCAVPVHTGLTCVEHGTLQGGFDSQ
ncbi:RING finger protein [Mycena venus]|uniref:RING finger protein n=1 Tax=Mycena venus TaxID=2733690 RepID=A0A8H6YDF8_9AGAR|nr:RING finger protein [Mycena venus]